MNAQVQPRLDRAARANPATPRRTQGKQADNNPHEPIEDSHDERTDPLWMISAAGALMFVFLAFAAAFG